MTMGFAPKKKASKKKATQPRPALEEDFEKMRQEIVEDDMGGSMEVSDDEDEPEPATPVPKKKSKKEEFDFNARDFSIGDDSQEEEVIPRPVVIGPNYDVMYYYGNEPLKKGNVLIRRSYIRFGKEHNFAFGVPKRNMLGLVTGLLKLMTEDSEVMTIGRKNAKVMNNFRQLSKALAGHQ